MVAVVVVVGVAAAADDGWGAWWWGVFFVRSAHACMYDTMCEYTRCVYVVVALLDMYGLFKHTTAVPTHPHHHTHRPQETLL